MEKQGRTLIPTATGDVVSSFIEQNFGDYISDTFTSEMENELDEIGEGTRKYEKTLKDFYTPFTKAVKSKAKSRNSPTWAMRQRNRSVLCGGPMVYKLSNGRFMSCANFPACLGARKEDSTEIAPPKDIGEARPECGDPSTRRSGQAGKLIEREGRFGRFIACSNYPKCKYVRKGPIGRSSHKNRRRLSSLRYEKASSALEERWLSVAVASESSFPVRIILNAKML